ncbi:MAG: hypothetical protein ACE5EK_11220, partial [Nitrospinales bacterium]
PNTFAASSFLVVWLGLGIPSYLVMIPMVMKINKRDLDAEDKARKEKKKKSNSGGPPIMDRDGF